MSETQITTPVSDGFIDKAIDEIRLFLDTCLNIINSRHQDTLDINKVFHYSCLKKYMNVFNKCDIKTDHILYFSHLFNNNRNQILSGKMENVLLEKNAYVQYGQGKIKIGKSEEVYRIMITEIYKDALENKKKAESLQNLIDFDAIENCEYSYNLHRDKNFLYKLSKIFYYIINTGDRTRLGEIVSYYENELSVPPSKRIIKVQTGEDENFVGKIVQKLSDAAAMNGVDLGINIDSLPNINGKAIENLLDNFLNNEATSNLFGVLANAYKSMDMGEIKKDFINNNGSINYGSIGKIASSVSNGDLSKIKEIGDKMNLGGMLENMNLGNIAGMAGMGELGKNLTNMVSNGDFDLAKAGEMISSASEDFDLSVMENFNISKMGDIGDMLSKTFNKTE